MRGKCAGERRRVKSKDGSQCRNDRAAAAKREQEQRQAAGDGEQGHRLRDRGRHLGHGWRDHVEIACERRTVQQCCEQPDRNGLPPSNERHASTPQMEEGCNQSRGNDPARDQREV